MRYTKVQDIITLGDNGPELWVEGFYYPPMMSNDYLQPDEPEDMEEIYAWMGDKRGKGPDIFEYLSEYWQDFIVDHLCDIGREV